MIFRKPLGNLKMGLIARKTNHVFTGVGTFSPIHLGEEGGVGDLTKMKPP